VPLADWLDIEDRYDDTLLLGNGASIALDACFSYRSLLENARHEGLVTADLDTVFTHFSTTDFEHVMRMLWYSFNVNQALAIADLRTRDAYVALRRALIETVRRYHAPFATIRHHLDPIQQFMGRFDKVLSLNYDLTVYWAMMEGNEIRGGGWFKDCWVAGDAHFESDWEFLETPYGVAGATLVFFPHGNLLFASHPQRGEIKISAGAAPSLLDRIVDEWEETDALPMFVSEGESAQKENAIARHGYLGAVYNDVMTGIGPSVAIYGWGVGENDEHILKRIAARRVNRIAVSVLRAGQTEHDIELHCQTITLRVRRYNSQAAIEFFDAVSPGAWLHPRAVV